MAKRKSEEGEIIGGELMNILQEQGVSEDSTKQLVEAFGGPFLEVGEILADYSQDEEGNIIVGENGIKVTDVTQLKEMSEARELRLKLRKARSTVENKRKELKEESLKTGRAIDRVAKFVKETIEPAEKYLETQEKFKELRDAAEAAARLARRTQAVANYTSPELYNLEQMSDENFDKLIAELEQKEKERIAAEEKAAAERAEAEKAERQRQAEVEAENKRLHAEAKERAALETRKIDRVNIVTQMGMTWDGEKRAYVAEGNEVSAADIIGLDDAKFKVLLEPIKKRLTELRAAAEKEKAEAEAARQEELRAERQKAEEEAAARKKLEDEKTEREAKEAQARRDAEAVERAALLAPDKEKILAFDAMLEQLREKLPATKTRSGQELVNNIDAMMAKMNTYIKEQVEKL